MEIHRGQFVIGPRPVTIGARWLHTRLSDGVHLSRCPGARCVSAADRDDVTWHLLGLAAQTDPRRPDPIEEIRASRTHHVKQLYQAWAGRWVLIGAGELHLDASGLLGCFYGRAEATSGTPAETWISTSAALLADLMRGEPWRPDVGAIREGGTNWYPPPFSRFRSIRKLLPSQILALGTATPVARTLVPDVDGGDGYEAILDALQESLCTAVKRVARGARTVWVPLSAGYDSRLVLAVALDAGLPVKTYTMRKVNVWRRSNDARPLTSHVSRADMTLPPLIARSAGVEHRWIPRAAFDPEALELFDRHTGGHTIENDRVYFSHGQWAWAGEDDVILRGGAFEVGHCFYWKRFPDRLPPGALPAVDRIVEAFGMNANSPHARGFQAWLEWAGSEAPATIDWRDRMYIEQRLAGWLSALEQALDLTPARRFYPVNAARIFALLLAIPEPKRLARAHHTDLIARMAPPLLRVPFNPPDPVYRQLTFRAMRRLSGWLSGQR